MVVLYGRQRQPELDLGRAWPGKLGASAVGLCNGANDGEPEPRPPSRGAGGDEPSKKLGLDVLGDEAGADDAHGGDSALASHDDARRAAGLTVDDRVVDEVVDRAREPVRLTTHDDTVVD